jgi:hypothetical protein
MGQTEFFGVDTKKVDLELRLRAETEKQGAFWVAPSTPPQGPESLRLFWGGHQESPFLAPQESQKSRRKGRAGPMGKVEKTDR